jgi:hypothetical protein
MNNTWLNVLVDIIHGLLERSVSIDCNKWSALLEVRE